MYPVSPNLDARTSRGGGRNSANARNTGTRYDRNPESPGMAFRTRTTSAPNPTPALFTKYSSSTRPTSNGTVRAVTSRRTACAGLCRARPGGGIEDDVGMDQRLIISIEARSGSGIGPRGGSAAVLGYDRVTVYCPQAVNWTVTFEVAPFRDTVAIRVPESKRGSTVQLALKCSAGLVVTASA